MGFPCSSVGKESACNAGVTSLILRLRRSPGEGNGNPFQYSNPGEAHGQRSQAGYCPWGCKDSYMTEWINTHTDSKHELT